MSSPVFSSSMLPIITTKKIHLSSKEKKVEVDFALNIPTTPQYRRMILSSPIASMYYFYFMILDDSSAGLLQGLKDPNTRNYLISSLYRGQTSTIVRDKAMKIVRFEEILQAHRTIEYGATDLSGDRNNEFRSSITIEYDPKAPESFPPVSIRYEDLSTQNLHLVCFIDLDLTGARPPHAANNNINYDLLLTRDTDTGRLDVPKEISSYYINDPSNSSQIVPYHGPVHYHGPNNPAPDGYIGWMAGHADGEMGSKLETVRTPNYKITSDLKVFEDQITNSNTGQSTSGPSWSSDMLLPGSNLRTEVKHNNLIKHSSELIEGMHEHSANHLLRNPNIIDYESQNTAYINYATNPGNIESEPTLLGSSHHGFAISINFLDLVKYRSRLGYLLDFHYKNNNNKFVENCLTQSKIKDMAFFRYRVVNNPYEINERQSTIYSKYDENEYGTYIISSSDRDVFSDEEVGGTFKHRLLEAETELGEIEEVEILQASPQGLPDGGRLMLPAPEFSRQFIVKDIDLFHNVNYGKYSYIVKIVLDDGIEKVITSLHAQNKSIISQYQKFLHNAEIPRKQRENREDDEGNYDYAALKFTESFRSKESNIRIVAKAILQYARMKEFLTGILHSDMGEEMENLARMLNLEAGNLHHLREFSHILQEMSNSIKSILSSGVDLSSKIFPQNYPSYLESVTGGNLKSIEITSKTNVLAKAIAKDTVVADFNPIPESSGPSGNFSTFLEALSRLSNGSFVMPSQFVAIDTMPYNALLGIGLVTGEDKSDVRRKRKRKRKYLSGPFAKRKAKAKKQSSNRGKGNVLIKLKDYNIMSPIKKTNMNIKMEYLVNSQLKDEKDESPGQAKKPDSFYPYAAQRYFGGITLGLSGGTVNLYRGYIPQIQEMLDFVQPGLSSEVKKSICDSVYKEDDRDFFIDEVERRYKDLVNLRAGLGVFYDYAHNLLLARELLSTSRRYNITFEDKFKDDVNPQTQQNLRKTNLFTKHGRALTVVSPKHGPLAVNVGKIRISDKAGNQYANQLKKKKVVCVKMDSNSSTSAPAVNNVAFLEI